MVDGGEAHQMKREYVHLWHLAGPQTMEQAPYR